jgi:uroporphyrinogen III methyltransferase/synthase
VTVYLVGAGPGDPGLLTRRGAELLARADVIVHDRLSEISLLDLAPAAAERIDVGKSPGAPVAQENINALLVERGRRGQEVVRLKGGVPFEVVPGISAAVAVPAYAGIPVTHRTLSTSFTVVTGHSRHAVDNDVDWDALARAADTIVVLMGVAHRGEIASRLQAGGLPAGTPVAAVRWGTRPDQRTVRTTLGELAGVVLEPPVTIVIGKVAALDLRWFESRPLFGRKVVVTRARAQASQLVERLTALGAETVELPTIEIADPADAGEALRAAAGRLATYDWVVLTSVNAVDRLFRCLRDARAFGFAAVAAVGPGTAAALAARGVLADLQPATAVAEVLVEAFPPPSGAGRVLLPQAAAARPVLARGLRASGWLVDSVEAYRTVAVTPSVGALAAAAGADAVAFTSSSTVTSWLDVAGAGTLPPVVACIGPVTAATAADHGVAVTVVASDHTVDGLVDALVAALRR